MNKKDTYVIIMAGGVGSRFLALQSKVSPQAIPGRARHRQFVDSADQ